MKGKQGVALADCIQLFRFSTEQLKESYSVLISMKSESIREQIIDVQTWLSASLTNLRTCMDGFKNLNGTMKVRMYERVQNVSAMVSISLAFAKRISLSNSNEMRLDLNHHRHLLSNGDGISSDLSWRGRSINQDFPAWMSEGDRRLLQSPQGGTKVDVMVAKDGTGKYKTIAAALNAAPNQSKQIYVIHIRAGIYHEKLMVTKQNIMLLGDGKSLTVVTGSNGYTKAGSTQFTANFMASANGFMARDMTFENKAGPYGGQAAALLVRSDRSAFYRCSIIGYQDTLYAHSLRQFYRECDIYGTIDFILGNAAAVFQTCNLIARKPLKGQSNVITAQGRGDPNENTGFSMHNCTVLAAADLVPIKKSVLTHLGRPWQKYSRTVYMQCFLDDLVDPSGWLEWDGNFALKTLYYGEYLNSGPGAGIKKRVQWPGYRVIKSAGEANQFTVNGLINGYSWLPSTGVAYQGGLIV
uniref:Pectin methylesterase 19 n=1 Tax=Cunninghamia lanceolata TaxID=28977 RepID=A0A6G9W368_CUNLA|nr:pectin methylesterase 19 [Cunninghamia lanceolata]